MGHSDVSRTFVVYGGWVREMGAGAASFRAARQTQMLANRDQGVPAEAGKAFPEPV